MTNTIKIKLTEGTPKLEYACKGDAGFDVRAMNIKNIYKGLQSVKELDPERFEKASKNFLERGYIKLRPEERVLFGTGIISELPHKKEFQARDKSGQALKKGIKVFNSPGTIDENFKDEICIIIKNCNDCLVQIDHKEKIAQLVLADVLEATFEYVDELDKTEDRGGGFGHTGVK